MFEKSQLEAKTSAACAAQRTVSAQFQIFNFQPSGCLARVQTDGLGMSRSFTKAIVHLGQ